MAEFALGLTKTAVEGTVSRVKSAIDEETKLRVRVQNDLVFITGEFQMMQSFLNVANKERAKNEVVRTWVRQIRDLAFDVEDCVELVVSLSNVKSGWSWLWRVLPGCMAPPRLLDQAVSDLQRLKARVEDVSHRNTRYNLISDSGGSDYSNTPAQVTNAGSRLLLATDVDISSSSSSSSLFHILREVWDAAGKIRHDMGDLKKLIMSESRNDDHEVISLWGGQGSASDLAKTHVVIREAYNDPEVCQAFKSRAWVQVMHPFNHDDFLNSLLTQFYASSHPANKVLDSKIYTKMRAVMAGEDNLIKAQLMQQVSQEQRYLVIVEALCTVAEWDTIRMYLPPHSNNGSWIVTTTTQQLGLALSFTGNPYQVSELRKFSSDQSLWAFFSKIPGHRNDIGELICQIRDGGVISVWLCHPSNSTFIHEVYKAITHKSNVFEGVDFDRHNWVDVSDKFDLGVFSRSMFFNFHSDDIRAKEILAAGIMGDTGVIEGCRKFLHEDHCLIVINGLKWKQEWDLIKSAFFSEPTKCCILIITMDQGVAKHCVDEDNRAHDFQRLDADTVLRHTIKRCEYFGSARKENSSRGHFFSNRKQEARDWINKFGLFTDPFETYSRALRRRLKDSGVISLCGSAWKSALARKFYYKEMLIASEDDMLHKCNTDGNEIVHSGFTKYSWVDVPHPFNLIDFCWRLFLDFHSDEIKAKHTLAFDMMKGRQDPVEGCRKLLHQEKCFVVIDGLQSRDDWDLIKNLLLARPTKVCILVITDEQNVATHCAQEKDRVVFIHDQNLKVASHPLIKKGYSDRNTNKAISSRIVDARDWINKHELIGRQYEHYCVSMRLLLRNSSVTSVWGIPGAGKSALVRSIYYHHIIECFNDTRMYSWVDVPELFNLMDFSKRLLMDFHSVDLEAKETAIIDMIEGKDPITLCHEFLQQHKSVTVINGLRCTDDWDLIKAAFLDKGIKGHILVITNEESIAMHCVNKNYGDVLNVKGLEDDAALNLFKKIAWGGAVLTPDKAKLSRIMNKCGGLPKIITAIAEYNRIENPDAPRSSIDKVRQKLLETTYEDFMRILETKSPMCHSLRGLFSWMQSYFHDCPDSLKPCIFYLSIFHSCHNIRRRRLLRRWIAEGYSTEENGEKLFSELIKLSIIQRKSPCKVGWCQFNGFFREYIISRPMQDNLVFELEGHCSLESQRAGQHLIISSSWDRAKILFESLELSRLRSLTVFGEWRSFFISADANMRLIRVLDLEDTSGVIDSDLENIGKLMPRLKFLSLRGCKDITRMPSSLGCLSQLQTLDIKGTSIMTLPAALMKLEKLQYVRAGTTNCRSTPSEDDNRTVAGETTPPQPDVDGTSTSQPRPATSQNEAATSTPLSSRPLCEMAFGWLSIFRRNGLGSSARDGVQFSAAAIGGIWKLRALHTLGVVNVEGVRGKAVLRELKNLSQLRKLRLFGISRINWQDFCFAISGHRYLESLSVRFGEEQQDYWYWLDDISQPPETLKRLNLYEGNVRSSPAWMRKIDTHTKVNLENVEMTVSTQEDIDGLRELQNLDMYRRLCVKPIQDGKLCYGWHHSFWSGSLFIAAKILKMECGSYMLEIVFENWILSVEVLVVHCTTTEASLNLFGLEYLPNLKEVFLKGTYSEAVKNHLQDKAARHPMKPVLKLEDQHRLS